MPIIPKKVSIGDDLEPVFRPKVQSPMMIHVDPSVFMDRVQNKSPSMNAWNGVPNSNVFDVRHSSPEIVELSESKSKIGNHVEE